jgi:FlaA1/EpsC-like NDP-sugar epimerase
MQLFFGGITWRSALLVMMDHALIVLGVVAGVLIRQTEPTFGWALIGRAFLIASVLQLAMHYSDLYDLRTLRDRRDLIVGVLQAVGAASVILALLYYWLPLLSIGRGVFFIAAVFIMALVTSWRLAFEWLSVQVGPAERLLIVGTSSAAVELARELFERRHELGVELIGFIDADESRIGAPVLNPGVIGSIQDIPRIVGARRVDRVVVSLADARGKFSMEKLLQMKLQDGVRFDHLASVYEEYTGKIAIENLRPSWLIFSEGFRKSRTLAAGKRLLDVVVAAIGLIIATPIMLLVAVGAAAYLASAFAFRCEGRLQP